MSVLKTADNSGGILLADGAGYVLLYEETAFITDTTDIQKPVDYALAGDQEIRRGRAPSWALRQIFRE